VSTAMTNTPVTDPAVTNPAASSAPVPTSTTAEPTGAKVPVAPPAATLLAVVLAVGVIALGVVAFRDALIDGGAIAGTPWITPALQFLDGLSAQSWMLPAGLGIAVIGVLLIAAAVKPRKRTHRPLRTAPDSWIAAHDVARVARGAATTVTGVGTAAASGSARRLTVSITPLAGFDTTDLSEAVRSTVSAALAPLANPPRIKIRIKEQDPS